MRPIDLHETPLSGRNLIEASAGTGKTYTIGCLYIRSILELSISVENILVVTFTEAATSELRERIRNRIRDTIQAFTEGSAADPFLSELVQKTEDHQQAVRSLKHSLARFEDARIFTIHGFCQRVLSDFAFESRARFDVEFIKDQTPLIAEITLDYWRTKMYGEDPHVPALMENLFSSPAILASSLINTLNKPLTRIITGVSKEAPSVWLALVADNYDKLAVAWKSTRSEIQTVLTTHKSINHRSYSKRNVPAWMGAVDLYLENGNPYLIPDQLTRFSETAVNTARKEDASESVPAFAVFDLAEQILEANGPIKACLKKEFIEFGAAELDRKKGVRNIQFFDDLLSSLFSALQGPGGDQLVRKIRERYRLALIDEFQDTDPIQYEIFRRIFGDYSPNLFYIGDPKQSIYNFRGADIFAYLTAQKNSENKYTLNKNWRSDADLVKAVNTIFSNRSRSFYFEDIKFSPTLAAESAPRRSLRVGDDFPPPLQLWYVDQDGAPVGKAEAKQQVAQAVGTEIIRLLAPSNHITSVSGKKQTSAEHPVSLKDIAVLVRSHEEGALVQGALRAYGIPSIINSKASLFQSDEFQQVVTILTAMVHPNRSEKVKAALVTDIIGMSGESLEELTRSETGWDLVLETYRDYHQEWLDSGFFKMMRRFIRQEKVRVHLLRRSNGERRLTNFLHAVELLREVAKEDNLGMARLLRWAENASRAPLQNDESVIRLETDDETVRIMTIHSSKGLEFPIVFCPFPWGEATVRDVFFHDPQNNYQLSLDLRSESASKQRQLALDEILAEELRLLYVALTRAKHRCYLTWGNINKTNNTALSYLFHHQSDVDHNRYADLERMVECSDGTIQLDLLPANESAQPYASTSDVKSINIRSFHGNIRLDWNITSFTRLSRSKVEDIELPNRDAESEPVQIRSEDGVESYTEITAMPGGTHTGNFFHEILEELDFQTHDEDAKKSLIQVKVTKYRLDDVWLPVIIDTVNSLLSLPLPVGKENDPFTLSRLSNEQRLSELEFHCPIEKLDSSELLNLIFTHSPAPEKHLLTRTLERLNFRENKGFVKGFVDLVFEWGGKYYIVDWKTNFLGSGRDNYTPDKIREVMIDHAYVLQYYIYTLALHRTLKLKLRDYSFDRCFGGVIYLFLRGIDSRSGEQNGVFFDDLHGMKPLIESLNHYLDYIEDGVTR